MVAAENKKEIPKKMQFYCNQWKLNQITLIIPFLLQKESQLVSIAILCQV